MTDLPDTIRFTALDELDDVAGRLLEVGKNFSVWLFEGHMGAGKTTLIKSLCKALGVSSNIHSPTFSIVNEYDGGGRPVYHFDFYRIKDETEALDIGVEEYFDSGNFCFVEWPGKIGSLWPEHYFLLDLQADEEGQRTLTFKKV